MKKFMLLFLSALLCLSLIGCANNNAANAPSSSASAAVTSSPLTEEEIDAMLPIMDSVILSATEGDPAAAHNASDPAYVWCLLYYICVNHPTLSANIEINNTDGNLYIAADDAAAIASACFVDFDTLPDVPQDSPSVRFDSATSRYAMQLSDRGETKSVIDSIEHKQDGTALVSVSLVDLFDEEVLCTYVFTLTANPKAETSGYPLTIASVQLP